MESRLCAKCGLDHAKLGLEISGNVLRKASPAKSAANSFYMRDGLFLRHPKMLDNHPEVKWISTIDNSKQETLYASVADFRKKAVGLNGGLFLPMEDFKPKQSNRPTMPKSTRVILK